jgi:hypothetical protein
VEGEPSQIIDVVGGISQGSIASSQEDVVDISAADSQGLDDSVLVIPPSPRHRHRDYSVIDISDESKVKCTVVVYKSILAYICQCCHKDGFNFCSKLDIKKAS